MDKYEFQIKTEQMEKLLGQKEYKAAAKIADSIDWSKIRNTSLLLSVSEIYENLERYEDCNEILNMAYDCAPIGRMIVYRMVEVAVKLKNFDEAIELYKEFIKIAPHDLSRYVLKYQIYQGRGSSVEDQIAILEEYKSREYQEQWAYELATLYYKEGMISKCVEECDDLILWFSEGEYVMKAMELKMRIQPLTASQEEKYRQMVSENQVDEIQVKQINMDEFNTSNLQAALAEGLQDFLKEELARETKKKPVPAPWIPKEEDEPSMAEELETAEVQPEEDEEELAQRQQEEARQEAARRRQKEARQAAAKKKLEEEQKNVQFQLEEEIQKPEEVPVQEQEKPRQMNLELLQDEPVEKPKQKLEKETFRLPRFLGQNESGQLTLDRKSVV